MNTIKSLALELPGIGRVQGYPDINPKFNNATIGGLVTEFASLLLMIAAVLMFVWFVWGAFEYIVAGGNKDALGKAQKRMTWAIIGFILFIASFSAASYATSLLRPVDRSVTPSIERNGSQQNTNNQR